VPHTKQQIQLLLSQADTAPHHKWGQNFLIDLNLMRLLVKTADLKGNETVLEVGCGTGSLTDLLAAQAGAVITVDIDPILNQIAQTQLAHYSNISMHCRDILANKSTIAPEILTDIRQKRKQLNGPFYLIANLPYNIAAPLIIDLLLGADIPDAIFVTIQTEVAQRITAQPNTKAYGQLTILTQALGTTKLIRKLNPQSFWPAPKVSSSMISWQLDAERHKSVTDIHRLKQLAELLIGHRRKKIKTCLAGNPQLLDLLAVADIDPDARGETLDVQRFVKLANFWAGQKA
jgi:16S rRNA (adenine1518-N6/adenine1519-N6)-dimethyltransferase